MFFGLSYNFIKFQLSLKSLKRLDWGSKRVYCLESKFSDLFVLPCHPRLHLNPRSGLTDLRFRQRWCRSDPLNPFNRHREETRRQRHRHFNIFWLKYLNDTLNDYLLVYIGNGTFSQKGVSHRNL